MRLLPAALLLLLGACQSAPPARRPPTPDASDAAAGDPAARACTHLQQLGCPLGSNPNCQATFRLPAGFGADPFCVIGAGSLAELGACNVTCQ